MNSTTIVQNLAANMPLDPARVEQAAKNVEELGLDLEKMKAVGEDFESVFISMMLKEMRNSLEGGGFFGEESSDTFGGMFDMFIGKHVASTTPLGIADIVANSYQRNFSAAGQNPATGGQAGNSEAAEDNAAESVQPVSISVSA